MIHDGVSIEAYVHCYRQWLMHTGWSELIQSGLTIPPKKIKELDIDAQLEVLYMLNL
jgi:hypothetical protein